MIGTMVEVSTRRADIVSSARSLFITTGFDGTAIGDIAKSIGVSKAAVYYYFPTKADFLRELADPLIAELTAVLDGHAGASWPDGVRAMTLEYFTVLISQADIAKWVDTDTALRMGGRPGTQLRALDRRLAVAIAEGSIEPNDVMRGFAVVGGLWRPLHHVPPERVQLHIHEIVQTALVSYAAL